jgi:peptidylprolyl isomerase
VIVGLALALAPGLALVDGCAKKQDADTQAQDVAETTAEDVEDRPPRDMGESQPEPDPPRTEEMKTVVSQGDVVRVQYKGTLGDGTVFDQSRPDRPLVFTAGTGQMIPGFDKAVIGMNLNETKTVTIPAAEAYGEPDDSMLRDIPKTNFPDTFVPEVDQPVTLTDQGGRQIRGTIVELGDETIKVDFNHPLAGKDLTFEITVVGIQ